MQKAIRFRSQNASLFEEGDFLPLEAAGKRLQNIVSFARRHNGKQVLIAVPRWSSQLAEPSSHRPEADWNDTILLLPPGSPSNWTSVITGEAFTASDHADKKALRADSLLQNFPVALLSAAESTT
jgi:(1->4)-alpha-D-glucan 1-alpha-D-glucosylmutase